MILKGKLMSRKMKKNKVTGWLGTIVLHAVLLVLLFLISISKPKAQEEGGVPVMLGNMEVAQGSADPYTLTDVDILNEPQQSTDVSIPEPVPTPPVESEMIVQEDEPTVAVPKKENPKTASKKEVIKKEVVKPKEKTEAEKRAEAERLAAEKKAAEEKAAAELAAQRIAGAFGKGTQMGSKGTGEKGTGFQGSSTGNSSNGQITGAGGYGSWDLNGRSLGPEGLPRPVYNVQEEGRVVVTITVNPAGQVIHTSINKRTNTASAALRKAAEDAARKAQFNAVSGVNNQTGTITYYFKLK